MKRELTSYYPLFFFLCALSFWSCDGLFYDLEQVDYRKGSPVEEADVTDDLDAPEDGSESADAADGEEFTDAADGEEFTDAADGEEFTDAADDEDSGGGGSCQSAEGCESGVCEGGECQAPSCFDGVQNGDETGVDCGGQCGPCPAGSDCRGADDCKGGVCTNQICAATCTDEEHNGQETDVDCGGPDCSACEAGRMCSKDSDCQSGVCTHGVCSPCDPEGSQFGFGAGTEVSPYLICAVEHLDAVRDHMGAGTYFRLERDIDLEGREDFEPIGGVGRDATTFRGKFDGNGFRISNYNWEMSGSHLGFFTKTSGVITDLTLVNFKLRGRDTIGVLAAVNNGEIRNVEIVNGSVNGNINADQSRAGLLVGINTQVIENSHSSGSVKGIRVVGGLVGQGEGGVISKSSSSAIVDGAISVGGLVGELIEGNIISSFASGEVKTSNPLTGLDPSGDNVTSRLGGLVGKSVGSQVKDSYSIASVGSTAGAGVGGLVGINREGSKIYNCYAFGKVRGGTLLTDFNGGLVGINDGDAVVENSYWHVGNCTCSGAGEPLSTTAFGVEDSFVEWDFGEVWVMSTDPGDERPILRWEAD